MLFLIIFVPEKLFQARQVSSLGSKSEGVYDHDFSASTSIATVTTLVNKRGQVTDKTDEALPSFYLWNIFKDWWRLTKKFASDQV